MMTKERDCVLGSSLGYSTNAHLRQQPGWVGSSWGLWMMMALPSGYVREERSPPSCRQPALLLPTKYPQSPFISPSFHDRVSMSSLPSWMQGKFYSCNDLSKMTEEECRYPRLCRPRDMGGSDEGSSGWEAFSCCGKGMPGSILHFCPRKGPSVLWHTHPPGPRRCGWN